MNKVIIKIYAGGAWEGHVCYNAINPLDQSIQNSSSSIEEVLHFCDKHNLMMDEDFLLLVKQNLIFDNSHGLIIPPEHIDEKLPISSASQYLKTIFKNYY